MRMILLKPNKIQQLILFLLLAAGVSGCATVPSRPEVVSMRSIHLKDLCVRNNIFWQWDAVAQVATLSYRGIKAEVLVGSDLVIVDKERITLSKPVRIIQSAVVVPKDFESKVIHRLRQYATDQKTYGLSQIREVIIDAGHGGKDPGAIGRSGEHEKKIVLDISRRLKKILQAKGIKVTMTRDSDEFISLKERTEIASRTDADLFVSIHANASPVRSVHGIEVFTSKYLGYRERNAEQRAINNEILFKRLSMKRGSKDLENIVTDMLYVHKHAESEGLAKYLSKRTAKEVKTKDRGKKESRFYVVKNTLMPAILVEVGFLSNPKESKLLRTSSYRQRLARSIADGIISYAKSR